MADELGQIPKPKANNTYLHARQEYAERYGDYIAAAKNWRIVALGALGVSFAMVGMNWHLANKAQTVPYVVQVDKNGQTVFGGVVNAANADNPLIIKGALETWIRDARSILTDPKAERHFIDYVYAFLDSSSPAYRVLTSWYGERQPFELAQKEAVDVSNINALPIGNISTSKTWTVTWDETTTQNDGLISLEHWTANITFERVPVKMDDSHITMNPIGLLITNYSWAKHA